MNLSVFDLFKIGIGPSSSHTVGPMRAAHLFAGELRRQAKPGETLTVTVWLYGSLGATGRGHATDRAIMLGLAGYQPDTVPAQVVSTIAQRVKEHGLLCLNLAEHEGTACSRDCLQVSFDQEQDFVFAPLTVLDHHPNGMRLVSGELDRTYFSVGGGFVVPLELGTVQSTELPAVESVTSIPYPFHTGEELLELCAQHGLSIAQIMRANELASTTEHDLEERLGQIWSAMDLCIAAGLQTGGLLPGGLRIARRAPAMHQQLRTETGQTDPLRAMDWINLYALAVNEENAAGHRVVTAPTNGAAGIVPSVIKYFLEFVSDGQHQAQDIANFLLAAAAVGTLIKRNASIAGAEVGCQGEVGSACAMAAAGLAQILGGTPAQVENAAEIAMEHNLGLTCDPIGGLVQVPCIERNAIGAVKAINAARMALRGDGVHTVSLDVVIETMRQTGLDMHSKYKETSAGGLAVNIIEC